MNKKAFLYSGVTFLLMISIMLSMSYLFLQKHSKEQTKIADLELDLAQQVSVDIRDVLAANANNTLADAMADAAFRALNCTAAGGALQSICNALVPTNILSETCGTNLTKWVLNYTNMTLLEIQNNMSALEFKSSITKINYASPNPCGPVPGDYRSFMYYGNISYNITTHTSFYMRLNQTTLFNKTLGIAQIYSVGATKIYEINVTDGTKAVNFNKRVNCTSNLCHPCVVGECFT